MRVSQYIFINTAYETFFKKIYEDQHAYILNTTAGCVIHISAFHLKSVQAHQHYYLYFQ